jgi:proteasome accessory factor C
MARARTAAEQLSRILQLLPLARRNQGVAIEELARELELDRDELIDDLETVASRADYHVAGPGEDTQIFVDAEAVYVWTTGEFQRPARFSPAESLALGMGLRILAADEPEDRRARVLALAGRLEASLGTPDAAESTHELLSVGQGEGSGPTRALLLGAASARRRCEILYLKPGADEPDRREVEPYQLVAAGGFWYLLARCLRGDAVRAFRVDRILEAVPGPETFQVPDDFDPHDFITGGKVFRSDGETDVVVRYSPRVARWIAEKGPCERCEDGSVRVTHRVADRRWIVRHVLQYGRDAEIEAPAEFRALLASSLGRIQDNVPRG